MASLIGHTYSLSKFGEVWGKKGSFSFFWADYCAAIVNVQGLITF